MCRISLFLRKQAGKREKSKGCGNLYQKNIVGGRDFYQGLSVYDRRTFPIRHIAPGCVVPDGECLGDVAAVAGFSRASG